MNIAGIVMRLDTSLGVCSSVLRALMVRERELNTSPRKNSAATQPSLSTGEVENRTPKAKATAIITGNWIRPWVVAPTGWGRKTLDVRVGGCRDPLQNPEPRVLDHAHRCEHANREHRCREDAGEDLLGTADLERRSRTSRLSAWTSPIGRRGSGSRGPATSIVSAIIVPGPETPAGGRVARSGGARARPAAPARRAGT